MSGDFGKTGFALHPERLNDAHLFELEPLFAELGTSRAGYRLQPRKLADVKAVAYIKEIVAKQIGAVARPVRALLFDKHAGNNWALGWHQDRTIEVQAKVETAGFGPWTIKGGRHHVAPPMSVLDAMITVRIHLDPADGSNAPLLVAPGSHRLGLISECQIAETVARCGIVACLAERGDVWLYATPILHASEAATEPCHRRVLQIDFSAAMLPNGLEWAVL